LPLLIFSVTSQTYNHDEGFSKSTGAFGAFCAFLQILRFLQGIKTALRNPLSD